jgi:CspA family cold shock protein
MPTGIVKWFNGRKGYGFIEPEDGGNDVFVHVTALKDSGIKFLNEGDKVSYELTENRGRMAAGNLSLDGESSSDSNETPSDEVEEAAEEETPEEETPEEETPEEETPEEEAAEEEAAEEDSEEDS